MKKSNRALFACLALAPCLYGTSFAASAETENDRMAFGEALFDCTFKPAKVEMTDPVAAKWKFATGLDAFTFLVWTESDRPASSFQIAGADLGDLRLVATKVDVTLTWALVEQPPSLHPEITLRVDRTNGESTLRLTLLDTKTSARDTYWTRNGKCVVARRAQ